MTINITDTIKPSLLVNFAVFNASKGSIFFQIFEYFVVRTANHPFHNLIFNIVFKTKFIFLFI
jgi:uncharacterized membrane protein